MLTDIRAGNATKGTFADPTPVVDPTAELRAQLNLLPDVAFGSGGRAKHCPGELSDEAKAALAMIEFSSAEEKRYLLLPDHVEAHDEKLMDDILSTVRSLKARESLERICCGSGRVLLRYWAWQASLVTPKAGTAAETEFNALVAAGVPALSVIAFTDMADELADIADRFKVPLTDAQMAERLLTAARSLGERVSDKIDLRLIEYKADGDLPLTRQSIERVLADFEADEITDKHLRGRSLAGRGKPSTGNSTGTGTGTDPRKTFTHAEEQEWFKLRRG